MLNRHFGFHITDIVRFEGFPFLPVMGWEVAGASAIGFARRTGLTEISDAKELESMIEKQVEQALRKAVRDRGGLALKFVSPGLAGVPDRIVLMPNRHVAFVELKAPGKHPRPLQVKRKRQLESLGFPVYCIDHPEQIGGVLDEICAP